MKNGITKYIETYGDLSFKDKEFTEIDAAIFSMISYINFEEVVSFKKEKISIELAAFLIRNRIKNKDIAMRGKFNKDVYQMFDLMAQCNRYKNIQLYGYEYKTGFSEQFGAISLILDDGTTVISFEGTDEKLAGWREDAELAYKFPVVAEEDAFRYFKRNVGLFTKKVIVLGHSKGGHLALVTSMYADIVRRNKIVGIYSFDGPGLMKEQIESEKYMKIESKYVHIVPNYSVIGLLLRNKKYEVVKSLKFDVNAHFCFNWVIDDNHFVRTSLSGVSKKLDKSISLWLDSHDPEQRERIVNNVFNYLQDAGIENVPDMKKINTIVSLVKNNKKLDKETKEWLLNFVEFNLQYMMKKE